ncbi:kinesin heavy chain-like [Orbicella faveolata]|uniref:kinesin heavy chain-like n=1 Tax=Orbicella faveolata TaxID=48498 RepID=UPI0009E266E3|nr:kinesin heavy chain-like [Orbicella faveolata]
MNSHMFFTVHIYQYRVEKNSKNAGGVHGGRSRLHLIDLASCEGYTGSKNNGGASSMSLSGLGNVIISLINGAKHVPHRTSKITRMLQESIGNTSCRTTMIAHVSPSLPFYAETLATVQLATRLHRLRKRKGKGSSTSSSGGESSCDEARIRKPRLRTAEPRLRTTALNEKLREDCPIGEPASSDYNSSTGEESCDTVIYVGPDGAISDRELTDNEGPPTRLPIRKSSVSDSTRSLVRKLESIENEEAEFNEEGEDLKREVEGSEDSGSLAEEKAQEKILSAREEGEGEEFSENYTEESSYETEIEILPDSRKASRKRLLENKGSSSSIAEIAGKDKAKRSKTHQNDIASPKVKEVTEISAPELSTLILPSRLGPNLDVDETMNSRHSTVVIPVQSFPGEEAKLRARVMSPETSSESSDAESIVMAKAPSFSFLTCTAVNDIHADSMDSLNMEQDLHDYEMSRRNGDGSSTSSSGGESSCDEARIRKPRLRTAEPRLRTTALNEKLREDCPIGEPASSDYNSSTGEESCDTVIYVGPDGAISDRELTDNEGPPTRLPIRKSSVSDSTRSLVRKLESIENEEAEFNEEGEDLKREVEGSEDSGSLAEEKAQEKILSAREEGEGEEFSENYTEESSYETEIEILPDSRKASRKRLLENKGSSSSIAEIAGKDKAKRN